MIDHTNVDAYELALKHLSMDFPVLEKERGFHDAIWNMVARKVQYHIEERRKWAEEEADKSIDQMARDEDCLVEDPHDDELRDMAKDNAHVEGGGI